MDKQGHDKCWYYPDIFKKLIDILEIENNMNPNLPFREEFENGCIKYQNDIFGDNKNMSNLFVKNKFVSHAGIELDWKIECDALSDDDFKTLASLIREKYDFKQVIGIPRGGLRLKQHLDPFVKSSGCRLIVDDVCTTGTSLETYKKLLLSQGDLSPIFGVVIFSRGKCPDWVRPVFQLVW